VVPFDDAFNPGQLPTFTVLQFPRDPPIAYVEGVNSDVYEEGADAERLTQMHEELRAAALSTSRSVELIRRVRDQVAR